MNDRTMSDTPFAQRLRCVMGVRQLTMREIGEACGVTAQAVHRWVHGAAMPPASALTTICGLGGCSMEWLLYPHFLDLESTSDAPQGRHAKYWVRETIAELKEEGLLR